MGSTRRTFVRTAAMAAGAFAFPGCSGTQGKAKKHRDEPLRLGVIGVGGRGRDNLMAVRSEEVAAICDVDRLHLAAAQGDFPRAKVFVDWREMLLLPGLDAVVISTPDHTHYPAVMRALQRELDVYCEKPLTHTVAQARRLTEVARARGLVTQMGTQIHANANYRRVVEAVQSGVLGAIHEVHVFVNGTDWSATGLPAKGPVPDQLDYALWLGPAAVRPFSPQYHPAGWRRWWAFGGGTTADMACHFMDLPFWALGLDAPTTVAADGPEPDSEGAPRGMRCQYEFAARSDRGPVRVHWYCGNVVPEAVLAPRGLGKWQNGVLFVGERGWLVSNYDRHELGPAEAFATWQRPAPTIAPSPGHHLEWLRACRERTQPSCAFDYAGPLTECVLLANVAYRTARGRLLHWDASALRFADSDDANRLLDVPLHNGFDV